MLVTKEKGSDLHSEGKYRPFLQKTFFMLIDSTWLGRGVCS